MYTHKHIYINMYIFTYVYMYIYIDIEMYTDVEIYNYLQHTCALIVSQSHLHFYIIVSPPLCKFRYVYICIYIYA